MNLLIVASTQMEIAPFLAHPASRHCDILISGVGVPSTTFLLTKQLLHHHYDLVIQAGVAGTSSNQVAIGDTVLVTKDAFADLGALEQDGFKSVADMDLTHELEWISNPNAELLNKFELNKVASITVNMVTDHKPVLAALATKWGKPEIESMEGAAFHYVCKHLERKFIQVRTISNRVGDRDKGNWKLKEAIDALNTELEKMVATIKG